MTELIHTLQRLESRARFVGRFTVLRELASGGMGAVYEVEQVSTAERLALKVMHPDFAADEDFRVKFAQEARVGARIASDHVVKVLDAGIDDATKMPWLVMELLQGETLHARVEREGALPVTEVSRIASELGHALSAAHDAGVVHCDLKPENVFLATVRQHGPSAPRVKVLDFGIARVVAQGKTSTQVTRAMGSPLWMAPEQAETGMQVRASTDLWPLGLIVYRLLTGKTFRRARAVRQVLGEVLFEPLPAASERARAQGVADKLPAGFDAWFGECVARDPGLRFKRTADALAALERVLAPRRSSVAPTVMLSEPPRPPLSAREPSPARSDGQQPTVAISLPPRPPAGDGDALTQAEREGCLSDVVSIGEALLVHTPADVALRQRVAAGYAARARLSAQGGARDRATMDATRAIELDPQRGGYYALRARLRAQGGELGPARDDFTAAIEREPAVAEHWFGRARVWLALGHNAQAHADFTRAASLGHDQFG